MKCLSPRLVLCFLFTIVILFYAICMYLQLYSCIFGLFGCLLGISNLVKKSPKYTIFCFYTYLIFTFLNIGFLGLLWAMSLTNLATKLDLVGINQRMNVIFGLALGINIILAVVSIERYYRFKKWVRGK
eukprot:NODE_224_length_12322_cov_0.795549.p14 type:complete len:129 gc:universal NODE_224_length_12322_cov_0.795549:7608-7222(-)